jgi:hypothetical protein
MADLKINDLLNKVYTKGVDDIDIQIQVLQN